MFKKIENQHKLLLSEEMKIVTYLYFIKHKKVFYKSH